VYPFAPLIGHRRISLGKTLYSLGKTPYVSCSIADGQNCSLSKPKVASPRSAFRQYLDGSALAAFKNATGEMTKADDHGQHFHVDLTFGANRRRGHDSA
jgi:hypothetical protein